MPTEYRPETCEDCGAQRDRVWATRNLHKGVEVPAGWRVARRPTGVWRVIERPTRDVTLCLCDAP